MTAAAVAPRSARHVARPLARTTLPTATDGPLMFAQVREDPRVEMQALAPAFRGSIAIVSSAGCTALSLVAAGARDVVAVDLSRTQNHLVELKCAAIRALDTRVAIAFLGAQPMPAIRRRRLYSVLAPTLGGEARTYWDAQQEAIERGVLRAGRSERFIALVGSLVKQLVVRSGGVAGMLAADSVARQREIFARAWSGWRWRALFAVLLNRWTISRAYHPAFFEHVENPSFASHFRKLAARTLTEQSSRNNYFVHEMLTGRYPVEEVDGVPPYLTHHGTERIAYNPHALSLVDAPLTEYLRSRAPRSFDGFALSNIAEWMDDDGIDALFGEVARTARSGARVVFRNFVGWTEIPERWRSLIIERRGHGDRLIEHDRSVVQRRVVVCDVRGAT